MSKKAIMEVIMHVIWFVCGAIIMIGTMGGSHLGWFIWSKIIGIGLMWYCVEWFYVNFLMTEEEYEKLVAEH